MSIHRPPLPRLSIVGTARPDAPPELGLALSQARAVQARSHLLGLLSELSSCTWQEEEAMDCGVRALDLGMGMGMSQVSWDSEFCGVILESSCGLEHCSLVSPPDPKQRQTGTTPQICGYFC